MTTQLGERYLDAVRMATELHADQLRKGTSIPYISHLLGVSTIVLESGGTEDEAIAGLLHDAVEDQGGPATLEAIRTRFGDVVATIVDGCTDDDVGQLVGSAASARIIQRRAQAFVVFVPLW